MKHIVKQRLSKELAKRVQERPWWLLRERHWDIFKDYRDSKQSADDLALLYHMSRAQVQNVINKILDRERRCGLSTLAFRVLQEQGVSMISEKLPEELERLKIKVAESRAGDLERYFTRYVDNCGKKTAHEIAMFVEDFAPADHPCQPAA